MNKFRKSILAAAIMAADMSSASAVTTLNNDFTMLNPAAGNVGGDAGVTFTWEGTYNMPGEEAVNATLNPGAGATFFGYVWTAHDVKILGPGSYTIGSAPYVYSLTVGENQVGMHMLFDWSSTLNIGVVEICQPGTFNGGNTWDCASVDGNGDGIPGIPMAAGPFQSFNANFSVNGLNPVTRPALGTTSPASGATVSASATTAYKVTFSKSITAATITSAFLSFSPTATVGAPTAVSGTNNTQFSFPVTLKSGTAYSVSFNTAGVRDATGVGFLSAPASKTLTTSAVTLASTAPSNGTANVSAGAGSFAVTFSETMNPATVAASYLQFSPAVAVGTPTTADNKSFSFPVTLGGPLSYTVAFGTGPKDATGGSVAAHANVMFSTAAVADTTSPTVSAASRLPAPGATGVALQPTLSVEFSEAMGTTTAGAIHVSRVSDSASVPCIFTPDATGKIFSCSVGDNLDFGSAYTVTVSGNAARTPSDANAAQDLAGNNLITGADNSWTFTTRAAVASMTDQSSGVVAVTSAGEITSLASSATPPGNAQPADNVTYDGDYVTYVVDNIPQGTNTVAVALTFRTSIAGKALYKVGSDGKFTQIAESATIEANQDCTFRRDLADDKKAIVTIRDNGTCDTNSGLGTISDPIVPGVAQAKGATSRTYIIEGSKAGGGCAADPQGKDVGLLAVLLAGLGYIGWRRRS